LLTVCLLTTSFSVAGQTASKPVRADLPPENEIWYHAVHQDSNGSLRYLRGEAKLQTSEMTISADAIDFNSDTNWAYARGHVHLEHFLTGDKLNADHGEYNLQTEEGRFYQVDGTSPAKVMTSPGVLTTTNPFYFQANWAERIKTRYILHHGFVTDCKIPKPWWIFEAPVFDVIPGNRAIARHTVFRLKHVPILYLPIFYRPLGRNPRQSGFLTPSIGNSSIRGYMYGGGYYWAINRSYDLTYQIQYFTLRGPAHTIDFRGKPNAVSDFNFNYYAVQDKGLPLPGGTFLDEGGQQFEITGRTQIWGFTGRLDYNYLSSYLFRVAFAGSFNSAISSEVFSIGYLQRHFKDDRYTVNIVAQRDQLFESVTYPGQRPDQVVIQKLPSVEVSGREAQLVKGPLPVWFSFGAGAGLLKREEPTFQTAWDTARVDLQPRVMTQFSFKGFSLQPSITFGATSYGNSYAGNATTYSACTGTCSPSSINNVQLAGSSLFRKDADVAIDFRLPPVERIFQPPKWLHLGEKLKHVIETQAVYEYVTGIDNFQKTIHFDSTDFLANTNQLSVALTNRLYKKDKQGNVSEILSWRVEHARYYDPTFGGAVLPNQRNNVLEAAELTPFAFLDIPRTYSPISSTLTVSPFSFLGLEWRTDYDPLRQRFVDRTFGAGAHYSKYSVSVSNTQINTNPVLIPPANQINLSFGYGSATRKGWNAGALINFDEVIGRRLYTFIQTSYNTDCCGFSFQLRQFNLGIRNENQYLFSFSVANLGTFGSLQRQERIF
jgi:LPS-assembly protein